MSSKHTAGPWRWNSEHTGLRDGNRTLIVSTESEPNNYGYCAGYKPTEANATLIAAAPELLKELERMVEYFDCPVYTDGRDEARAKIRDARAAIAKAKGATA